MISSEGKDAPAPAAKPADLPGKSSGPTAASAANSNAGQTPANDRRRPERVSLLSHAFEFAQDSNGFVCCQVLIWAEKSLVYSCSKPFVCQVNGPEAGSRQKSSVKPPPQKVRPTQLGPVCLSKKLTQLLKARS